ncbi:hypothetical protein SBA2_10113 [Acidobacteriia bacterium SbA2]|nr:hypothetical protein SBA2_10113 [Acidobacteriia bacterium SbA2]
MENGQLAVPAHSRAIALRLDETRGLAASECGSVAAALEFRQKWRQLRCRTPRRLRHK